MSVVPDDGGPLGLRSGLRVAQMLESDGPGGAENVLSQLSQELSRRGHTVIPVGPDNGCGWLAEQMRDRGFTPQTFSLRRPIDLACYRGMKTLLGDLRVDVIHSHEFTMAVYGAAVASALKKPHIITFHGGVRMLAKWRRRAALRWAMKRSLATVAVSESTRLRFAASLGVDPAALQVVPNGIEKRVGVGERLRTELALANGERLVVAVGNVIPVKGHITLVRALARLDPAVTPWRLAIAGELRDGAPEIREFAAREGLNDRIVLLGRRLDIPDILAAADLFVMPSLSEGLPLALLEAMFAGRAIIASSVGGIPEVIRDDVEGLLVPPGDPGPLAVALDRLLGDPSLRDELGSRARARAEDRYSVGAMTDGYEALYRGPSSTGPGR